jgi:hypothetical protein
VELYVRRLRGHWPQRTNPRGLSFFRHPAAQNTPRRHRGAAPVDLRPAAAFETDALHIALDAETRDELRADNGVNGSRE